VSSFQEAPAPNVAASTLNDLIIEKTLKNG
jgi:hypothetical protein